MNFKKLFYLFVVIGFSLAHAGAYEDFFAAVARDDTKVIAGLLQRGFDPSSVDAKGVPAITLALQRESLDVATLLLEQPQLDVNALNPAGESPLMMAALKGRLGLCERLLARGARVNLPGWSPLHYAAAGPNPRVIASLLARGAVADAESPNRSTPLMLAARHGPEEGVELLLTHGADPKRRNERGLDAADFARLAGREKLARRLDALAR